MESPDFWSDQAAAKVVIGKVGALRRWTLPYRDARQRFDAVDSMIDEADAAGEEELVNELLGDLARCEKILGELEIQRMLSHELDEKSCYLSINAGAGGTEACDWAQMLVRMYERWAVRKGWKVELVDKVDGDVAGIKSLTLHFMGSYAYGYAKAERGVHRIVRISPFDSAGRRHTSFASVDVWPEIEDTIEIEIRPEDLRIDTYRASGSGGQHVNKTDSAVRMTHIPSGVVVSCQAERSQFQNRETCLKLLRAKLYQKQVQEREASLANLSGEKKEIGWGSQIRSYIFQPYTLVKDNRTKVEVGNIHAVMDGEIDEFVNAYLKEFGG